MGTIDTLLRVKADASAAVRGLAPLQASLEETAKDAAKTETALGELDKSHKISLNDQAITSAKTEIDRLRASMREQLVIDPTADVRDAQRKIAQLQKSIKVLDAQEPVVQVEVEADTAGLAGLRGALAGVGAELSGGGGLTGGLTAARVGLTGLGAEGAAAATGIGAMGIAAGVAAKQAWDLGEAAADVETSVAQLTALTGDQQLGENLFADLQQWAAATPFAIDDATEAAKRLLAAGVPLSEITADLSDMGNVAAATGAPLAQIATVFAQMESRGKATFEDLQQLAEANIPVWGTLADQMGLTIAQVQDLASQGKLSADAIDLVREALAQKFPTAMSDQSAIFNGQMSTLHDTLDQTGQTLGTLFLPLMTDLAGALNVVAGWTKEGAEWLVKFNDELEDITGSGAVDTLLNIASLGSWAGIRNGIDDLNDLGGAADDAGGSAEDTDAKMQALADSVAEEALASQQAAAATQAHADQMQALADHADDAQQKFTNLRDAFTILDNSFVTSRQHIADVQGGIDDLAQSLVEGGGTFDFDLAAGRENFDNLVALGEAASQRVMDTFKKDGPAAAAALDDSFRDTFTQMLIDAKVAPHRAKELIDGVFKTPTKVRLQLEEIDTSKLEAQKAKLTNRKAILLEPVVNAITPRAADELSIDAQKKIKPIDVKLQAVNEGLDDAKGEVDDVANPKGKHRKAHVDVKVDPTSISDANEDIDNFIKLRRSHVKVFVDLVPVPPAPGLGFFVTPSAGTSAAPAVGPTVAASVAPIVGPTVLPSVDPTSGLRSAGQTISTAPVVVRIAPTPPAAAATPERARLAPSRTPVAVYLDGVEIASRIEARRALAAIESVRRTA